MERKHGYSISSFPDLTEEGEDKLFDLCETLVLSEKTEPIENEDWVLTIDQAKIDAENKVTKKVFTIWVDLNKEMENAMASFAEWEKKDYEDTKRVNNRLLKAIESIKGKEFVKSILDCAEDSEVSGKFEIVNKPKGDLQEEDYGEIKGVLVDQWCNGGYVGDDFQGHIYVELKSGKYLKMYYSC